MRCMRRVLYGALLIAIHSVAFEAHVAHAQFLDPTLRSLDLSTAPLSRSPRLLGMGGLSIVVPDRDRQINLWDFAGLTAGAMSDDTVSTLDFRPSTASASGAHTLASSGLERQDLAARANGMQIETFHRDPESGSAFGFVSNLQSLRWDRPYDSSREVREGVQTPEITPILGGRVPGALAKRLSWAAHLSFGSEHLQDEYRTFVSNAAGEFIDLDGTTLTAPDLFTPTDYRVNRQGAGLSLALRLARTTQFGVGITLQQDRIKGSNTADRSEGATEDDRPYAIGQAALVGTLGPSFEYGVSGRAWQAKSEASWRFTVSSGVGADALQSRGKLLDRDERASALDAIVRWHLSRLLVGGTLSTSAGRIVIDPPAANDPTSLNRFLDVLQTRAGADTLALPDSVVHQRNEHFGWAWGVGASYPVGSRLLAGGEFHYARDLVQTEELGKGPRRVQWDARGGLEYQCLASLRGRLGYAYRSIDLDDYTDGNEFIEDVVTAGLGYHPAGTSWSFEAGYAFLWRFADFTDLDVTRQSRQTLAAQIHWGF